MRGAMGNRSTSGEKTPRFRRQRARVNSPALESYAELRRDGRGRHRTADARCFLATTKQNHGRNALNAKARGDVGERFGVDLRDDQFSATCAGDFVDLGRDRSTRPAPCRPKIDEHGSRRVGNELVEILSARDWDRALGRQERSLARRAPRVLARACSWHPIHFRTRRAGYEHAMTPSSRRCGWSGARQEASSGNEAARPRFQVSGE